MFDCENSLLLFMLPLWKVYIQYFLRFFDRRLTIIPIQISQLMVESKIAMLHAIRIEHWDYVKDE